MAEKAADRIRGPLEVALDDLRQVFPLGVCAGGHGSPCQAEGVHQLGVLLGGAGVEPGEVPAGSGEHPAGVFLVIRAGGQVRFHRDENASTHSG